MAVQPRPVETTAFSLTVLAQLRANVWIRYFNILLIPLFASGIPMPADRGILLACAVGALAGNIAVHIIAAITKRYRLAAYLLLGLDLATMLPAVYVSGFLASPFLIILVSSVNILRYLSVSIRVSCRFGAVALTTFAAAFWLWWHRVGAVTGWDVHAFPAFTLAAFALQLAIMAILVHQYTFVPGPAVAELERQERQMAELRHRAELGATLVAVANDLKKPLGNVRQLVEAAARSAGRHHAKPGYGLNEAGIELGRLENQLAAVSTYARENPIQLRKRRTGLRDLARKAADFVRLRHRNGPRIVIRVGVDPAMTAACDPAAIHHVFVDLLEGGFVNRVPGRPVTIEMRSRIQDRSAVITVRDNGHGAPPGSPDGGAQGGPHYLARRITEAHGGRLEFETAPGAGTTAVVWLPLRATRRLPTGRL
jgi:signal transduction histidine kinase